jgi:ABC-type glycerol-3-phosphate transport system substrate-binding protein
VFWQFWPADVVQPILERYEKEHPDVHVRMEQLTWQSGLEKITAAVASGNVPDLCEMGSTWMPRMLQSGALQDVTQGTADLRSQLNGWGLCSTGDQAFGVPWVLGTRALFYNKTLFARAGLDSTRPPETWQELHDDAAAIQKLGGGVHGYGVQAGERYVLFKKFMPFAWGKAGGSCRTTSPRPCSIRRRTRPRWSSICRSGRSACSTTRTCSTASSRRAGSGSSCRARGC